MHLILIREGNGIAVYCILGFRIVLFKVLRSLDFLSNLDAVNAVAPLQ